MIEFRLLGQFEVGDDDRLLALGGPGQRALLAAPGEARSDWRIVADVATAMGYADAFGWRSPAQVFREWARLTAYANPGRLLNLGPLAGVTPDAYDALAVVAATEHTLKSLGKPVQFGAGVAAAQKVLAELF